MLFNKRGLIRHILATLILILLAALFIPTSESFAKENKLPYGSSCFNSYGNKGNARSISHAIGMVRKYFAERGYYIRLVGHTKVVMKVEIYDKEELIDTVIVDLRSGKFRSMQ